MDVLYYSLDFGDGQTKEFLDYQTARDYFFTKLDLEKFPRAVLNKILAEEILNIDHIDDSFKV